MTQRLAFAWLLQSLGGYLSAQTVPEYTYQILHTYPHDRRAYTQGLEYHDGFLYEGTGLNGESSLRRVRLETGEVLQRIPLAKEFFGEGIVVLGDEIAQLTWRSEVGFVYRLKDFHLLRRFSYSGEGWGLTNDGSESSIHAPWPGRGESRFTTAPGRLSN